MKITNHITPEILDKVKNINDNCREMHLPSPPVTFINFEIEDKDGKIIEQYSSKSNSWVRNAHNSLASIFLPAPGAAGTNVYGAGGLKVKNISGTAYGDASYPISTEGATLAAYVCENATTGNFGIFVGSSNAAESFEDYTLGAKIASGTAAGQLSYNAMTLPTVTYDAPTLTWTSVLERIFNNNSTALVSVNESGLVEYLAYTTSNIYVLMSRDVLSSPMEVPVGGQLKVKYTTTYTMPA